jgi:hypothetical protein
MSPSKTNDFAFITNSQGRIGILTQDYYFTMNADLSDQPNAYMADEQIFFLNPDMKRLPSSAKDSISRKMNHITTAMYETAKWMLMNNK